MGWPGALPSSESRDLCSSNFLILTLRSTNQVAAAPCDGNYGKKLKWHRLQLYPQPEICKVTESILGSVSNSSHAKTSGLWVFGCGTFRNAFVSHPLRLPRNLGVSFKLLPRKSKQVLLATFLSLGSWFGFYLVKDRAIPSTRLLSLQRRANWRIKGNPSFQVTMAPSLFSWWL